MTTTNLAARVEAGTEADRAVDWVVHCLGGTASLDAVCALIDEKRPGKIASTLRVALTRFAPDEKPTADQIARAAISAMLISLECDTAALRALGAHHD